MAIVAETLLDGRNRRTLIVTALACVALFYVGSARLLFQDDAFIHLRIAHNLMLHGYYSFNGDSPTYSTSSPLFTALLGVLSKAIPGPYLPKILDVVVYAALFCLIARIFIRASTTVAAFSSLAFLAAVASPIGVRWLTDGMETGLTGLVAVLLGGVACDIMRRRHARQIPRTLLLMALGAFATTLRVEFSFIIALIGCASLTDSRNRWRLDAQALALAFGSVTGLLTIWSVFGTLLPDTAIAKVTEHSSSVPQLRDMAGTIVDIVKAQGGASFFGVMMGLSWFGAFLVGLRNPEGRWYSITLNAGFMVFIALIVLRNQQIQGYRYFVFIEFFLASFNTLNLPRMSPERPRQPAVSWALSPAAALAVGFVFIGAWQIFDYSRLQRVSAGRSASFLAVKDAPMADLAGTFGIAWDVGFVGYFSNGVILDADGLINGREIARMHKRDRLQNFVSSHPIKFVFANDGQLSELDGLLDMRNWTKRGSFDFPNFGGETDRHYLLVRNTAD